MSSTADKVNALWNVQMVQRRHLEKLYPYLDWSKMPFSSYNDFFRLKNIIDDCGAVWTNAYRRSNNEAADTRKYLKDWSGNGRDIELFNFAFAGGSGYNGFVENYYFHDRWAAAAQYLEYTSSQDKTVTTVTLLKANTANNDVWLFADNWSQEIVGTTHKIKIKITGLNEVITKLPTVNVSVYGGATNIKYTNDGIYDVTLTKNEGAYAYIGIRIANTIHEVDLPCNVIIEQLPDYPGALVSDGIDDYGQCVKDFSLPNDYTVVAVRKHLDLNKESNAGTLVSKTPGSGKGAFYFEYNKEAGYSYGSVFYRQFPTLFSYQTKLSYNDSVITAGSSSDSDANKLTIFREGISGIFKEAALSSFGIFTRTLTEDELRIVKNCMMAEYIAMTGALDDVEYYDILDARFRSNEEDAEKRNKWTGRFGKLHLTLNNFAYSKMSGWNGSYIDFTGYWTCDQRSSGLTDTKDGKYKVIFTNVDKIPAKGINYYQRVNTSSTMRVKVRVSGLMLSETFSLSYRNQEDTQWIKLTAGIGDCTLETDVPATQSFLLDITGISDKVDRKITLEIIPIYPGALVSDGVDDSAVSDEVIDEPIGGIVVHAEKISEETTGYFFLSGQGYEESLTNTIASYFSSSDGKIRIGIPGKIYTVNPDNIYGYSKSPATPGHVLNIAKGGAYGDVGIYQLRLIKSQPTDLQLEAIKWQMQKEHEDYLIQNGWMEIEPDEQ